MFFFVVCCLSQCLVCCPSLLLVLFNLFNPTPSFVLCMLPLPYHFFTTYNLSQRPVSTTFIHDLHPLAVNPQWPANRESFLAQPHPHDGSRGVHPQGGGAGVQSVPDGAQAQLIGGGVGGGWGLVGDG